MQTRSLKTLIIVVCVFFFTSNLTGSFLPIYYKEMGLSVAEIVELLLFTFLMIGLLPLLLIRLFKNFERIISLGIFATMLFFVALIYSQDPVFLGLTYGFSIATFWPSFNLLQLRLSESRYRARTVSLLSSIIPSLASIVGPATGGFIISAFGFATLFVVSIVLYLVALVFSLRIDFRAETCGFAFPKGKLFAVFFSTLVILGLSEAYWLASPLFVLKVSGTVLFMGVVLALSAVLVSVITFLVNWLSDVKMARVRFAVIGTLLHAAWYFAIAFASTMHEVVILSLLSGFAGAFSISWFAHYGDSFDKKYYASMLVLMETGLMIGRIANLIPTYLFVSAENYSGYFIALGTVSLFLIPLYYLVHKTDVRMLNAPKPDSN